MYRNETLRISVDAHFFSFVERVSKIDFSKNISYQYYTNKTRFYITRLVWNEISCMPFKLQIDQGAMGRTKF